MKMSKIIGHRIKVRRTELGLSQQELARILGVSQSHLSGIEVARHTLTVDFLTEIAETLKCKPTDLFFDETRRAA